MKLRPLGIYAVLYLAFLYVPVLFLPIFSFNDSAIVAFPLKGITTQWYAELWDNDTMHGALWNSLKVGCVATLVATVVGTYGVKATKGTTPEELWLGIQQRMGELEGAVAAAQQGDALVVVDGPLSMEMTASVVSLSGGGSSFTLNCLQASDFPELML